mmetsp:Transcript_33168/g.107262  ORF Transcript_33168/g.107262 Transcript_33168/m.107262 type:complete len:204 (+) Transcript_33168:177-788(+)
MPLHCVHRLRSGPAHRGSQQRRPADHHGKDGVLHLRPLVSRSNGRHRHRGRNVLRVGPHPQGCVPLAGDAVLLQACQRCRALLLPPLPRVRARAQPDTHPRRSLRLCALVDVDRLRRLQRRRHHRRLAHVLLPRRRRRPAQPAGCLDPHVPERLHLCRHLLLARAVRLLQRVPRRLAGAAAGRHAGRAPAKRQPAQDVGRSIC